MKSFLKELFEYSHHSNIKLIKVLESNDELVSERAIKLMSHILNAQRIWNNRIAREEEPFKVWQIHDLEQLEKIENENYARSVELVQETDLDKDVGYVSSHGIGYMNKVRDILFHAVNHSTYHRAQIASDLKAAGIEPPVTDYIAYKRP